jgi:succinyl-diaminopimelate desuccinylase
VNAISVAIDGLRPILEHEPRPAVVGGLTFQEVLSVTRFESGIADNVIPSLAVATVSFRYAPDRSPGDARAYLRALLDGAAEIEVTGDSPAGAVVSESPHVEALRAAGARTIAPKQAWTNVADFTSRGIDAVNFGPGLTAYAHRRDELVEIDGLVHAYETLRRFLIGEDEAA